SFAATASPDADADYVSQAGTLTFNPGETSKTISVVVNPDCLFESNEFLRLFLSNPQNVTLGNTVATGTISNNSAGCATANITGDEFIALYDNTGAPIDLSNYRIEVSNGSVINIPAGATIQPRGHYLVTHATGYTLGAYAAGDATYNLDLPATAGLALLDAANTNRDAVGFNTSPAPFFEGTGLTPIDNTAGQYGFVRKLTG